MLKILQARLQQHVNQELPDVQAGFRKGRGTRDQIANMGWVIEKAREFQKNIYFCFIDYTSGKFLKIWEYQTTLPACWETCMQVRKRQIEPDMEQWTGSKLGKEHIKTVYCHPAYFCLSQFYLEYIRWSARLDESQAGIKIPGEILMTSDMQMIPP